MPKTKQPGFEIKEGERLDDLVRDDLKIIQKPGSFCFSMDAVLLGNFATVKKGDLVADLGTGSGVIPLLLTSRQRVKHITGLDIQETSVERAARSVAGNGLLGLISIIQGDIRTVSAQLGAGKFDLVTANPPYMAPGKGKINPTDEVAIARHEICCSLEDVIREGARLLNSHGRFALVHRPERLTDILFLFRKYGVEPKRLRFVYPSVGRKPNMVLVESVKGAKAELDVIPPLFVYDKDGEYTRELMEIYYPGRQEDS